MLIRRNPGVLLAIGLSLFAGAGRLAGQTGAGAPPAKARVIRPIVNGSYVVQQEWWSNEPLFGETGVLYDVDNVGGFLVVSEKIGRDSLAPPHVYPIMKLETDALGNVHLNAGDLDYRGYQTDDGFFVWGSIRSQSETDTLMLLAQRSDIARTRISGLYQFRVHTETTCEGAPMDDAGADWAGPGVVAAVSDTIYIVMRIKNDRAGGDIVLAGNSPYASDGSFAIQSRVEATSLEGRAGPGRIEGTWRDDRGQCEFGGRMLGEKP